MGSPTFQEVLLKLQGSDEEGAIAKEIQKAVKQTPGVWPRAPTSLLSSSATRQMSSVVCFNCGRRGHIAWSCWRPQNNPTIITIIKLHSRIKAATSTITFVSILAALPSLRGLVFYIRRVVILHTPVSLSGGKLTLLGTTLLA